MRKSLLYSISLLFTLVCLAFCKYLINIKVQNSIALHKNSANSYKTNIKIANTITFDEYLQMKKTKESQKYLKVNANGDVVYKNNIILTTKGEPLNKNTAYTDNEFKVLFEAEGVKPRKGCDPRDTATNGSLGCYIDIPD